MTKRKKIKFGTILSEQIAHWARRHAAQTRRPICEVMEYALEYYRDLTERPRARPAARRKRKK